MKLKNTRIGSIRCNNACTRVFFRTICLDKPSTKIRRPWRVGRSEKSHTCVSPLVNKTKTISHNLSITNPPQGNPTGQYPGQILVPPRSPPTPVPHGYPLTGLYAATTPLTKSNATTSALTKSYAATSSLIKSHAATNPPDYII